MRRVGDVGKRSLLWREIPIGDNDHVSATGKSRQNTSREVGVSRLGGFGFFLINILDCVCEALSFMLLYSSPTVVAPRCLISCVSMYFFAEILRDISQFFTLRYIAKRLSS